MAKTARLSSLLCDDPDPMAITVAANKPPETAVRPTHQSVSVVIPCFNQGRFLSDAVESVLGQSCRPTEIVVVDDGSDDETAAVAARYAGIRYVHQANQGLPAARNTGIRATAGDYLMFLDADDRLLPGAIETNLWCLRAHPEWAFVSGEHRYIDAEGRVQAEWTRPIVAAEHYRHLLAENYVGMHATVMYRRAVFENAGLFDETLEACEDYDLYLRIARSFPVGNHEVRVAEYRRHGSAMSNDLARMLRASVSVLRSQAPFVAGHPQLEAAYAAGLARWRQYYGAPLAAQIREHRNSDSSPRQAAKNIATLMRYAPGEFGRLLKSIVG